MSAPLWFDNLAAYSIQVALLTVIGAGLAAVLRLRAPRVALAYWQALLTVCLALPLIEPWNQTVLVLTADVGRVGIEFGPLAAKPSHASFPIYGALALALSLGVAYRLLRMAFGLFRLRLYSLRARAWEPVPPAVSELRSRLGLAPALLLSEEIDGPVTYGSLRPVVLFPARFAQMDSDCQVAIVCHELIHIRKGHWFFNLAEEVIQAIFWFHPAVAWMVRRIRLAREQSVDSEVLRLTQARQPYLRALIDIAAGSVWPLTVPAPEFMKENQLTQRVALMLKEASMSKPRLVLSLSIAVATLFLAGQIAVRAFPLKAQPTQTIAPAASVEPVAAGEQATESAAPVVEPAGHKAKTAKTDQDDQKLHPIRQVNPVYPPLAKVAKIGGTVELEILVQKNGEVSDVKAISGHPLLVKAAIDAVRQWKFAPEPSRVKGRVTVIFTPDKEPSDAEKLAEVKAQLARIQSQSGNMTNEQIARKIAELKAEIERGQAAAQQSQMTGEQKLEVARLRAQEADLAAKANASRPTDMVQAQEQQIAAMKAQKAELEARIAEAEQALETAQKDAEGTFTPKPVKTVAPVYPPAARAAHVQGLVVLRVSLDENGGVTDVEAESGPPALTQAAIDAVRQWRFSNPYQTAATTSVTINFALSDAESKPPASTAPPK
jgi:bla regulator protein blaR1